MEIRHARLEEIDEVMKIYSIAREYMRENGNMHQWINGYPGYEEVAGDIADNNSYVCILDGSIAGVFAYIRGIEPTYEKIYEGEWLNSEPYGVVHRIASAANKRGVASYCLSWCLADCGNLRIDTHRDNIPMQGLLKKMGFSYCGIIYLKDGSERLAFQKIAVR